jgi:hypothetical protein
MADDEVWLHPSISQAEYQRLIDSYDQGASPRELVVEACRRDQPHLIDQVLDDMEEKSIEEVAEFFNTVKDALGHHALHICATYGSCMSLSTRIRVMWMHSLAL